LLSRSATRNRISPARRRSASGTRAISASSQLCPSSGRRAGRARRPPAPPASRAGRRYHIRDRDRLDGRQIHGQGLAELSGALIAEDVKRARTVNQTRVGRCLVEIGPQGPVAGDTGKG
jgi:hypothetical protein